MSIKRHIVFARMVATGTYFGRLCAFIDIAAYQTEPADRFLAFPDSAIFDGLTQIRHSVADSAGAGIDRHRHSASFEIFEENLAVMQLVVSCFGKNIGQTEIFFFCGLFCINKCSGYKPLTH